MAEQPKVKKFRSKMARTPKAGHPWKHGMCISRPKTPSRRNVAREKREARALLGIK